MPDSETTVASRMRCFFPGCPASVATGANLFRINATGQPGVWSCQRHRAHTDAPRDPELDELVSILGGKRRE
jgi:hypothetical protein